MKQRNTYQLIYGVDEVQKAADYLYKLRGACSIYTFTGSLGAGKTTLVQALLRSFGVTSDIIMSPTFTYVQIYHTPQQHMLYHFDLYRLADLNAFNSAGFDEYLYQPASWSFIEWPEIIEPLLQERVCRISLEYEELHKRRMTCEIE